MKANRPSSSPWFWALSSMIIVVALIGITVHKDSSIRNKRNLEIAKTVARIYSEGKSKGITWDTSSSEALVADVIMLCHGDSVEFQGKLFGGDIPGVVNPMPSGVAELIYISPDKRICIIDPTQ